MTILAVANTHTIIWYIFADPQLSPTARVKMDSALVTSDQIVFSYRT